MIKKILFIVILLFNSRATFHLLAQTCVSGDIVISSGTTVTWNPSTKPNPYTINQNVCIENGATLNIDNINVLMDGLIKITIHNGGTLNTNFSILRPSPNSISNEWEGIYVKGDNDQPLCDPITKTLNTAHHGQLHARFTTIERSKYGIKLEGNLSSSLGAGIIRVNGCSFVNNSIAGIYMGPYHIAGTSCRVNSVANSFFNADIATPRAFISMVSYRYFTVLGCTFEVNSLYKKNTAGIEVSEMFHLGSNNEIVYDFLQSGGLVLEESEYQDPYIYSTSPKNNPPRRNKFTNLKVGILFDGAENIISEFESQIKGCDFDKVKIGVEVRHGQTVNILCNTYLANKFDDNVAKGIAFAEYDETAGGGLVKIIIPTQPSPVPISIFGYCFKVGSNVNFINNYCEFNTDFDNKQAIGIAFNGKAEGLLNYKMINNTIKYTGVEGNKVTGLFYHGDFVHEPQIMGNTFDKLYRDMHLKGVIRPLGGTCFNPVLSKQGERYDASTQTFYTVGNSNVFSEPAIDANIFGDAADVFYVSPASPPAPNYDPNQRTPCVAVYSASTGLNVGPLPVDCGVPPVSGLLSDNLANHANKKLCLELTPNPATNNIEIRILGTNNHLISNQLQIRIFNSIGILVYNQTFDAEKTFVNADVNLYPSGLYMVQLLHNNQVICTDKLIKQ